MKQKAVVVLSGGQDSTTCLFSAIAEGFDVHCVTFDYGQRHHRELESARTVAHIANCADKHEIITLGNGILKSTSPLVSDNELEQYADYKSLPGGLEKTFVPMRNQLFLTIAANRAFSIGSNVLYTGVCQADSGGYPDCRDTFIKAFQLASSLGTFNEDANIASLQVRTPLMDMTKAQSVHYAMTLPGCYRALAYSHTSYDGKYPPTGNDHATLLRARGFEEANIPDPLVLRAYDCGLMELPETENYKQNLEPFWDLIYPNRHL